MQVLHWFADQLGDSGPGHKKEDGVASKLTETASLTQQQSPPKSRACNAKLCDCNNVMQQARPWQVSLTHS